MPRTSMIPFALVLALAGCATMSNPGKVAPRSDPLSGETVRTAVIRLKHWTPQARFYEGGVQLPVFDVLSASESERARALCVWADTAGGQRASDDCDFAQPGLVLDATRPHALRVVRSGREGAVTVSASLKTRWIFFNMFLGPFYPVGLVVDAVTSKWKYYGDLDVERVLDHSDQAAR